MDGDKDSSPMAVGDGDQQNLMDTAQSSAEDLLNLAKQLRTPIPAGSKLRQTMQEIRSILLESEAINYADADVQVDVKPEAVENQMNSKEANEWLEMAITALSVNEYQKAEEYLMKFNSMCPSDQVNMILDKIHLKIPKIKVKLDPDAFMVRQLVDIANKAIFAKDLEKAQELLTKAESIKPTPETQNILKNINQTLQNRQIETSEKLIEYAMTAMSDDDYDIAEMLLKTAWIQYKHNSAKKLLDMFFQKTRNTKNITHKTKDQVKATSATYAKIAVKLISDDQIKAAESILIIARNTSNGLAGLQPYTIRSPRTDQPWLDNIHNILYPNTVYSSIHEWTLHEHSMYVKNLPTDSVASYKSHYFVEMAFRAFKYADDANLALEFLREADINLPNNEAIQKYIAQVKK